MKGLSVSAIAMPFIVTPSRAAAKQITLCHQGGTIVQGYEEIFFKPFMQATGIKVIGTTAPPNPTAEIRMMTQSKRYLWDMTILDHADVLLLAADGLLEKHDLEHEPVISSIAPQFRTPYSIGTHVHSIVLAYRTEAFNGSRRPESWEDFWDTHRFPGRRSLRKHPHDTTEVALMADGVPPRDVYPCDLDRAFRSLEKIKPHVSVWWTNGPQTEQLLQFGEVDLLPVWFIRVQAAIHAGAPVAFTWNQHVYGSAEWAILKGTPNAEACRQFIKFVSDPERQALLTPYGTGPTQPDAFKYVDPKHAQLLPTYPDNLKKGLLTDAAYWVKHQQAALEQFNNWILKG